MSSEFWAACAGAIVGAMAGGGITWALQFLQNRRETLGRNRGLAHSIIFKLIKIHSDLHGFKKHVDECAAYAATHSLPDSWQSLRAIANLPSRLSFTPEEMSYLLSLKNFELFNKVLSLDVVHSSTIGLFELYSERRKALMDMSPAAMQGTIGTATMNDAQLAVFAPRAVELDLLASDIKARVEQDSEESREALTEVNAAVATTLGRPLKLEIKV